MKRKVLIVLMTAVLISALQLTGDCQVKGSGNRTTNASHLGTWRLDSYKYSASGNFVKVPENDQHIKLITETHFMWAATDPATGKVSSMAGGTYTLKGNTYTEAIDFGIDMNNYLGHKQNFTLLVEGDLLFLSGVLSDGYHVEEVWHRVK